jgi:hypothetical protein
VPSDHCSPSVDHCFGYTIREVAVGAFDDLVSFSTALGNGIVSVGKDMYFGAERTAEGLGVRGYDRMAEIGLENQYLLDLLINLVRGAVTLQDNPLYKIVRTILEKYYQYFPDDVQAKLCKAAAIAVGYGTGRMVVGRMLAQAIALRIVVAIAETEAYKELVKKIGVAEAGAGAPLVGTLITLVMTQGVGQRSSRASRRLMDRNKTLWIELRNQSGLDMIYFLVESPMAPYMDAIDLATNAPQQFVIEVRKAYQ